MATVASIEKELKASFRGIQFLVKSEDENTGKKLVTHEFINSNKRGTESLGKKPSQYNLNIIIHGKNAINDRIRLREAFQRQEPGLLVHPVYGSRLVDVRDVTFSSGQNEKGQYTCTVTFYDTVSKITPRPEAEAQTIAKTAEDARTAADDALEEGYKEPSFVQSIKSATTKANEIYNNVNDKISNVVNPIQENVSKFTNAVSTAKRRINSIVRKAASLKDSFRALYQSALSIVRTPGELYDQWKKLIDFSFLTDNFKTNTVKRVEESTNARITSEHQSVTALINAYEAAVFIDFETEIELNEVRDFLENAYTQIILENNTTLPSIVKSSELRRLFQQLRTQAREVFDKKQEAVFRIVDIDVYSSSSILTTYDRYGNLDNSDIIRTLNTDKSPANYDGNIKAVSS